jgi:hypothetical protein
MSYLEPTPRKSFAVFDSIINSRAREDRCSRGRMREGSDEVGFKFRMAHMVQAGVKVAERVERQAYPSGDLFLEL